MGYLYWPHTQPPYTPYTYIEDRVTPLNHQSIMNGIARDIGSLQHNINTTNLFASGWVQPVVSGYFKNIDTNYLYSHKINTRYLVINDSNDSNIRSFDITGSSLIIADSKLIDNIIPVTNAVTGPSGFLLSGVIFNYNPIFISGYYNDYYLTKDNYIFDGGWLNTLKFNNDIIVDNNHSVIVENITGFSPSGSINETSIKFNSVIGHNHLNNKINANTIIDTDITFNNDLIINNNNSYIKLTSGLLSFDSINTELNYDDTAFYELSFTKDSQFICSETGLSGYIKDTDIGLNQIISYDNKIYATSKINPTGSIDNSNTYLYYTEDLLNWNGILVSGNFRPSVSGVATIDDLLIDKDVLYFLWNYSVNDHNHSMVGWVDNNQIYSGVLFSSGLYAHGSSRYGVGLGSVENTLVVYGYEYPHVYSSGIPQWDKHCSFWSSTNLVQSCDTTGQDISFSGVPYKYSFPFIECYHNSKPTESKFWLDGTYQGREPYLNSETNGRVYDILKPYSDEEEPLYSSGYYAAFFGNGFSEITSILSTQLNYHNGNKGIYSYTQPNSSDSGYTIIGSKPDVIDKYNINPVLVFGNSTINVNTSDNGNIFGGCTPLVIDVDNRLFSEASGTLVLSSGIASYSPVFLHGSTSLMDNNDTLFRIPGNEYGTNKSESLINSNLYNDFQNNIGRLWFDYTSNDDNINRTELINLCPWKPGYLTFPFAGSGSVYYKHDSDLSYTKLIYESMIDNNNGIIIPPSSFNNHRNFPVLNEKIQKDGFWRDTTFDWYYVQNGIYEEYGEGVLSITHSGGSTYYANISGGVYNNNWLNVSNAFKLHYNNSYAAATLTQIGNSTSGILTGSLSSFNNLDNVNYIVASGTIRTVPSGVYPKTYYYMRPKKPVQHNGIVYCILENYTGYTYLGPNGTEYSNDNVFYSDLIKYGNILYGVGIETIDNGKSYNIVISTIRRNTSTKKTITPAVKGYNTTPKFVIHNGLLYVGLGYGRFLVKKPSHINLSLNNM